MHVWNCTYIWMIALLYTHTQSHTGIKMGAGKMILLRFLESYVSDSPSGVHGPLLLNTIHIFSRCSFIPPARLLSLLFPLTHSHLKLGWPLISPTKPAPPTAVLLSRITPAVKMDSAKELGWFSVHSQMHPEPNCSWPLRLCSDAGSRRLQHFCSSFPLDLHFPWKRKTFHL